MLKLDSKKGTANGSQEAVYNYLSNFKNFAHLLPAERFKNLEISEDRLSFGIDGLGTIGLRMAERNPFSNILVTGTEDSTAEFTFHMQLSPVNEKQTLVNIQLQANLNMFLEMVAKGPLQQFIDLMIDKLSEVRFEV